MVKVFEATSASIDGSLAIVASRFNPSITSRLVDGAVQTLLEHGVRGDAIHVAWVPGAFEIPLVAQQMAMSGRYVAVICLGAVIRGETTHDQHINRAVSLGLMEIGLRSELPVLFGILTCESLEQAIHRSGGNVGNKGRDCAEAACQLLGLLRQLPLE